MLLAPPQGTPPLRGTTTPHPPTTQGDAHALPSSHLKSGAATSCRGICRKKSGFWHRGFPVTIFLLRSQSPSHASWQLQLKGLARRFLEEAGGVTTKTHPRQTQLSQKAGSRPPLAGHTVAHHSWTASSY